MQLYRIYLVDSSQRITGLPIEMTLPDDVAAVEKALLLEGAYSIEIWQRERLVTRIGSLRTAGSASTR